MSLSMSEMGAGGASFVFPKSSAESLEVTHAVASSGKVALWVVCALMAISAVAFAFMTFARPMADRTQGYITTATVTIAAIAYYVMAAGEGIVDLPDKYGHPRAFYYARYVDWIFTTPLLILDIVLFAGIPISTTIWIIFADVAMIATGIFAALCENYNRWGFYIISSAFFLIVLWGLLGLGQQSAKVRGTPVYRLYIFLATWLAVTWVGYPIVWGFSEGSNLADVATETIAYGILDVLSKVVFGWVLMLSIGRLSLAGRSALESRIAEPLVSGNTESA